MTWAVLVQSEWVKKYFQSCSKGDFVLSIKLFSEIGAQATETLSVDNGGKEGDWYAFEMCPSASFATGFRIKVVDKNLMNFF